MHERQDNRYAPPLSMAEEAAHPVGGQYLAVANSLPSRRAFAWFGAAWALFRQRAGWWFGLVLVWTILSYILAAAMQAFMPSVIPFFPAVRDFAAVFAMAGVAYAAERVEQQARIDWRASLVVLVRCAGALVLLGLLNVVFEQLLLRVGARLEDYAMQMAFQSPSSMLLGLVSLINSWKWLFFMLAYLLPNGVAPMLVVCRRMGAVRAWAAGWRGMGRNVGGVVLAVALATLLGLAVRLVVGVAVVLAQPKLTMLGTIDAVPPVWMIRVASLVNNMVGLMLMLVLYAACRDVFFKRETSVKQAT